MRMWEIREGSSYKDDYHYDKRHPEMKEHDEDKSYDEGYEAGYEEGYIKAMKDAYSRSERSYSRMSR